MIAYAHQGGAKEAPSSTLYAIRRALDNGATGIELDVHATSDRQLVVCHDPTLDRTTAATGEIASRSLEELRQLDNAYWFCPGEDAVKGRPEGDYVLRGRAPDDRDLGIATLAEVLEAFPGVVLNLDIKRTAPEVAPYEEVLARELPSTGAATTSSSPRSRTRRSASFSSWAPGIAVRGRHRRHDRVLPPAAGGGAPPEDVGRYVALQVPARFGQPHGRRRELRRGRPRLRSGRPRVDGRRPGGDGASSSVSASTGSSLTSRVCWRTSLTAWQAELERSEVSRDRSSASCRGLPSSSCAACA